MPADFLGEVIELSRIPQIPTKNLHDPVTINTKVFVPSTSDLDLYRKSDVDSSLQSGNPYTTYATLTEDISIGSLDTSSPYIASIGSGPTKVSIYSVFANSERGIPSIRASSSGLKKVYIDSQNKLTYGTNIAWTVVSNGSKFFAYPFNIQSNPDRTCRTSTDGITWVTETLTGDYPQSFLHPSTARWYYNATPTGYGIVPRKIPTSDIFSIGIHFFLFDSGKLYRTEDGLVWTDITTDTFGNTTKSSEGFYVGISGT